MYLLSAKSGRKYWGCHSESKLSPCPHEAYVLTEEDSSNKQEASEQ